jgi:hypothetical protein
VLLGVRGRRRAEGLPEDARVTVRALQGLGLTDKLYWRRARGRLHCFKKARGQYAALCDPAITIARTDGQAIRRPVAVMRCAVCDAREMSRRGWDESGPETVQLDE